MPGPTGESTGRELYQENPDCFPVIYMIKKQATLASITAKGMFQ